MIHLTNLDHPITRDLSQDINWGTNNLLSPIFHVDDESATILGNVVYAQGRCLPGFAIKEYPEWTSIYSAAPNLPASVLRGIARFAGVHLFSNAGDVVYATPQLLAVHTATGGSRTFRLPVKVAIIYELFDNFITARDCKDFQIDMPAPATFLFYTGSQDLLDQLPGFHV